MLVLGLTCVVGAYPAVGYQCPCLLGPPSIPLSLVCPISPTTFISVEIIGRVLDGRFPR